MNYNRLETSLIDVIKEEQAKLGYMKEKISLYYPLSSLNHFFGNETDAAGMMEILKDFPSYIEEKFGRSSSITQRRSFLLHCFGKTLPNMYIII